jgi:hypothetical protein
VGWFSERDAGYGTLLSANATETFTLLYDHMQVYAYFSLPVEGLTLDAHNAGFDPATGNATYGINAAFRPRPEWALVMGILSDGTDRYLQAHEYTIDLGGLDFEKAGEYTITYTYKADTAVKSTLTVSVTA